MIFVSSPPLLFPAMRERGHPGNPLAGKVRNLNRDRESPVISKYQSKAFTMERTSIILPTEHALTTFGGGGQASVPRFATRRLYTVTGCIFTSFVYTRTRVSRMGRSLGQAPAYKSIQAAEMIFRPERVLVVQSPCHAVCDSLCMYLFRFSVRGSDSASP